MFGKAPHTPTEAEFEKLIQEYHLPRYDEIPDIELYMDQLIKYVGERIAFLPYVGENPPTSSMVNNYVKQKLMPKPQNKRYTRIHVVRLIVLCILKMSFSFADIQRLIALEVQHHYQIPEAYDFFCTAFEESLRVLFLGKTNADKVGDLQVASRGKAFAVEIENVQDMDEGRMVAIAAATSAATKVYVEAHLDWLEDMRAAEDAAIDEAARAQAKNMRKSRAGQSRAR